MEWESICGLEMWSLSPTSKQRKPEWSNNTFRVQKIFIFTPTLLPHLTVRIKGHICVKKQHFWTLHDRLRALTQSGIKVDYSKCEFIFLWNRTGFSFLHRSYIQTGACLSVVNPLYVVWSVFVCFPYVFFSKPSEPRRVYNFSNTQTLQAHVVDCLRRDLTC